MKVPAYETKASSFNHIGTAMRQIPRYLGDVGSSKSRMPTQEVFLYPLDLEEIGAMLETLQSFPQEFRLMTYLGLYSGLSKSEAFAFPDHAVRRPELGEESPADVVTHIVTTTGKTRPVLMPVGLMAELYDYRFSKRPQIKMEITDNSLPNLPLFLNERGEAYNKRSVTKLWTDLRQKVEETSGRYFRYDFGELQVTYRLNLMHRLLNFTGREMESAYIFLEYIGCRDIRTAERYMKIVRSEFGDPSKQVAFIPNNY